MAWTASIVGVRENPVPNGHAFVDVQFSDGASKTFVQTYKISPGQFGSSEEIEAFVQARLAEVAALQDMIPDLVEVSTDVVPRRVTNFQARAALIGAGLFESVDSLIRAMPTGSVEFQAWEYANHVYRSSPLMALMASQFGLTEEQIDDLFRAAALVDA